MDNRYEIVSDSNIIKNDYDHLVYDFYPDREFEVFTQHITKSKVYRGQIHYVPVYPEAFVSYESLILFYLAESANFQVVVYGTKNLFPFWSLISHKCIMVDNLKDAWMGSHPDTEDDTWEEIYSMHGNYSMLNWFPFYEHPFSEHPPPVDGTDFLFTLDGGMNNWEWMCPRYYFLYDFDFVSCNRYPYYEIIKQLQRYPKDEELVDFYKDRRISILQSSYDESQEIFESELYEHDKTDWFEFKKDAAVVGGMVRYEASLLEKYFSNTVMENTLNINDKPLQTMIDNNFPNSYMTCQVLSSLEKSKRFSATHGAAALLSCIPHINCEHLVAYDSHFRGPTRFKKMTNKHIYEKPTFCSYILEEIHKNVVEYGRWLQDSSLDIPDEDDSRDWIGEVYDRYSVARRGSKIEHKWKILKDLMDVEERKRGLNSSFRKIYG